MSLDTLSDWVFMVLAGFSMGFMLTSSALLLKIERNTGGGCRCQSKQAKKL